MTRPPPRRKLALALPDTRRPLKRIADNLQLELHALEHVPAEVRLPRVDRQAAEQCVQFADVLRLRDVERREIREPEACEVVVPVEERRDRAQVDYLPFGLSHHERVIADELLMSYTRPSP